MTRYQNRVLAPKTAQQLPDANDLRWNESSNGLVENHQGRAVNNGLSNADPLFVTVGERIDALVEHALEREAPRLFWLSVSYLESESQFLETYERIFRTAQENGVSIVVGGRALHGELRKQMSYSAHCDQLRHMVAFAQTLYKENSGGGDR